MHGSLLRLALPHPNYHVPLLMFLQNLFFLKECLQPSITRKALQLIKVHPRIHPLWNYS